MFKHQFSFQRKLNIAIDAAVTLLAYFCSLFLVNYLQNGLFALPYPHQNYLFLALFAMVLWPLLLIINGIYPTDRLRTVKRASIIISKASFQGFMILLAVLFILKLQTVSRLAIVVSVFFITAFLIIKESLAIWHFHALRKAGRNLRNVLVIGTIKSVRSIVSNIEKNSFLGLKVLGLLVPEDQVLEEISDHKVLGSLKDIETVLHNNPIDHVIITIDRSDYKEVDNVITRCEEEGVEIWLTASLFNLRIAKLDSDELFGVPLFIFRTVPKYSWQLFIKGALDIFLGTLVGLVTLPIIAVAAILIKATSKGPVLFKQKRVGLQGREFLLYKLRTMYVGAHEAVKELNNDNIMKGPVFKLVNDPRVTPVGRFLRKTSIDELPQLWNVIKGEMSLVGPRPPMPEEVMEYKGWQRRRLSMKPGITGLWQVSGRSKIVDFDKWVELDLKYIDNWSLLLDLKIFAKTVFVVLTGYGAH